MGNWILACLATCYVGLMFVTLAYIVLKREEDDE